MEGSGGVNHTGISNFISEIDRVTPKKTEQQTKVKLVFDKAVSTLQETVSKIRPTTKVPEADRTQLIDTIEKFNSEVSSTHDLDSIDVNELKRIKHFVKTTYLRKTPQGKEALLWIESLKIIDKIKTHPESAKELYKDDASVAQQLALFLLLQSQVPVESLYVVDEDSKTFKNNPDFQENIKHLRNQIDINMKEGEKDSSQNTIKNLLDQEFFYLGKLIKNPIDSDTEKNLYDAINTNFALSIKNLLSNLSSLVSQMTQQNRPIPLQKAVRTRILLYFNVLEKVFIPKLQQGQLKGTQQVLSTFTKMVDAFGELSDRANEISTNATTRLNNFAKK